VPVCALFACTADYASEAQVESKQAALGIEGRWMPPAEVLAVGDMQNKIEFVGAGPWLGEESCGSGLEPGTMVLGDYLEAYFPQVSLIGGFSCRPINGDPTQASVHSTGRALDIHIPLTAEEGADNDLGDPIAHWLIRNADRIGIQLIIWDLSTWGPYRDPGERAQAYGGAHPHDDHLHVELTEAAAGLGAPWFDEDWAEPDIVECPALPPEGGVVDERGACAQILGPSRFWRFVEGAGEAESLFWTDAVQADDQSNWARWQPKFSEAGEYELDVYVDPMYAIHQRARYELVAAGTTSEIIVDQGSASGWHSLGTFSFDVGTGQSLSLFDNNDSAVEENQQVVADAIRLTRVGDGSGGFDEGGCGCRSADGNYGGGSALLLLAIVGLRRRRDRLGDS
jgi:MYXO-CTERM domain-containing protein